MHDPYRDEAIALRDRLDQINREIEAIHAGATRRSSLEREAAELQRRIDDLKKRGPLDDLRVATPCHARWDEMTGDNRIRFCGDCKKNVYNVSGMTRVEAMDLLTKNAGTEVCLKFARRADGTVITADCPVGVKAKRVRRLAVLAAGVTAGLGALGAALGGGGSVLGSLAGGSPGPLPKANSADEAWTTGTVALPVSSPPPPVAETVGSVAVPSPPPPKDASKLKPSPRH